MDPQLVFFRIMRVPPIPLQQRRARSEVYGLETGTSYFLRQPEHGGGALEARMIRQQSTAFLCWVGCPVKVPMGTRQYGLPGPDSIRGRTQLALGKAQNRPD